MKVELIKDVWVAPGSHIWVTYKFIDLYRVGLQNDNIILLNTETQRILSLDEFRHEIKNTMIEVIAPGVSPHDTFSIKKSPINGSRSSKVGY